MSAESLTLAAGALLSLAFSYIPGLADAYAGLDGVQKRLVMLALLVLVAVASFGLSCLGWGSALGISLACDQAGALGLLRTLLLALIANQSTYLISPQRRS